MDISIPVDEIRRRLKGKGEWWELYIERRKVFSIRLRNWIPEAIRSEDDIGAGLRLVRGDGVKYVCASNPSEKTFLEMVDALISSDGDLKVEWVSEVALTDVRSDLIKMSFRALDFIRGEKLIKGFSYFYEAEEKEIRIITEEGEREDLQRRSYVSLRTIAREDNALGTGYESYGISGGEISEDDLNEIVKKAVERAVISMRGAYAPAGRFPVVIAGEAGGTMIHEAVGHGFEADHIVKGSSVFSGKIGEKVAADCITVVDDPTLKGERGSYAFDDEGEDGVRVVLIERGILKDYLRDKFWGLKMGLPSNGHGRRESYRYIPLPRMSNTYILPGDRDPEEIIRCAWNGIYVKKMGGGEVNTTTGDFVFYVPEAYRIENGKVGEPLRPFTIGGNGPSILMNVEMVGNDFGKSVGNCGKKGQLVPISDGMPTILVREMLVGGMKVK